MENNNEKKLTKWLNKLQQESWQLELVISGFSIFLMLGAWQGLKGFARDIELASHGLGNEDSLLNIGYVVLLGACFFILINLVLHVLLRGIWISTIGLRYVSGDIDFDSLRLAPKFDRMLRRKVGSFDQYILKLENLCSVVFAFTFLIAFMLISLGMYMAFIIVLINLVIDPLLSSFPEVVVDYIEVSILGLLGFFGLLYLIDFLTLSYVKRVKWLSHIYLPFYRLLSLVTLSFLYRPIYYNLIDNKFGRWVGYLLVPYVLIIILAFFERIHSHVWYPDNPKDLAIYNDYYDDQRDESSLIMKGSIPSKFVTNGFLQLFIAYLPKQDNSTLAMICPDFKPFHEPGFGTSLQFTVQGVVVGSNNKNADTALSCLSDLYEIHVDDSLFHANYRFYRHANYQEYGLVTMLDVNYLPRGEHEVVVKKIDKRVTPEGIDILINNPFFQIPFWKE